MLRILLLLIFPVAIFGQTKTYLTAVEREQIQKERSSGFADLDIDMLHGEISWKTHAVINRNLPKVGDSFPQYDPASNIFATGIDSRGKKYLRVLLREGSNWSMKLTTHPVHYIFRAHCFLFPSEDGKKLDKIVIQFYRLNYNGNSYQREIRRMIHPEPLDQAMYGSLTPGSVPASLLNNSKLIIESVARPSGEKATYMEKDGIPFPEGPEKMDQIFVLNDEKNPIPFDKQVKIKGKYKSLLELVNRRLTLLYRDEAVTKLIDIENAVDFSF